MWGEGAVLVISPQVHSEYTIEPEIFARRKVLRTLPPGLVGQNLFRKFLSCVNHYIQHMATFIMSAKFYFTEYFCNTRVAGLAKIFVQ